MKLDFDCVVIGAGVAGMTSAIYLKRAGINVAIFERSFVGGQINKTYTIKNYPGFQEIDGPTLALSICNQLKELDIPIIYESVVDIINEDEYKIVKTTKKDYLTKAIVIATGKKERSLGLKGEKELIGHGISWCATCDGNFFKSKEVAVVGGGNTAMEDALYLSNICKKVYIVNRSTNFKADLILLNQAKTKKNIEFVTDSVVKTLIKKNNILHSIILDNGTKLSVSGLFIAIGSDPVVEFLKNLNLSLENNYILVNKNMETSIPGIYACGDVIKKELYQIITAASDGAIAANSVKNYLNR
ncbi:MAG: FAD-dependent oxidoreductase [Firmicutes bacterium]|nr:FAD-dependent oxidoreductase [Bacillota bacterium]